jgi:hypothetical protein
MTKEQKGEDWSALRKSWKAYKIAKGNNDTAAMDAKAQQIQKIQKKLGLEKTRFK